MLPATPEYAIPLLAHLRQFKMRVQEAIRGCEDVIIGEMSRTGIKTLRADGFTASAGTGTDVEWDIATLQELKAAGLPEERFRDLVTTVVSFKVNAAAAKQIAAANPEYAAIIERARRTVEKRRYVSVK